jgi:hypothetical protein
VGMRDRWDQAIEPWYEMKRSRGKEVADIMADVVIRTERVSGSRDLQDSSRSMRWCVRIVSVTTTERGVSIKSPVIESGLPSSCSMRIGDESLCWLTHIYDPKRPLCSV